jgi:hypothetical protein
LENLNTEIAASIPDMNIDVYLHFFFVLVKDENDLFADSHNILNRWKNYFSVIECTWGQ